LRFVRKILGDVRFVRNWWLPTLIRLGVVKRGYVVLRTGEVLEVSRRNWESYVIRRNLAVDKGVFTYFINGGYLAELSYGILWAPNLKLVAASGNEDLVSIYPREFFSGKVVIDVGAYIGDTAVLFSKFYKAKKVVAIEPHPLHYRLLLLNLRLNKVSNVEVMNRALCSEGVKEVCVEGFGQTTKTREKRMLGDDMCGHLIGCVGLKEVIRKYEPNTIKIDCEGCEYLLLNTDLEILKRVDTYVIEFHSPHLERGITKRLRKIGCESCFWAVGLLRSL